MFRFLHASLSPEKDRNFKITYSLCCSEMIFVSLVKKNWQVIVMMHRQISRHLVIPTLLCLYLARLPDWPWSWKEQHFVFGPGEWINGLSPIPLKSSLFDTMRYQSQFFKLLRKIKVCLKNQVVWKIRGKTERWRNCFLFELLGELEK